MANAPRVGIGYDVHRFQEGRKLVLGGIEIPNEVGLLGHSDADAAAHAVIDAMLGAAGLGDIGQMFPDTDAAYKGIDSMELLRRTRERIEDEGYVVSSIDVTIVAERPKLAPHTVAMKERLAEVLGLVPSRVGLKATTNERLGSLGRAEGVAAIAAATLVPLGELSYEEDHLAQTRPLPGEDEA